MKRSPARHRPSTPGPLRDATPELGRLLAGTRRPLQRALKTLDLDSTRVTRLFRRLVRQLTPARGGSRALAALDPLACYQSLSSGGPSGSNGDEAYRLAVEKDALTLMGSGVSEDHAIAAVGCYLEASLGSLGQTAEVRALVRLTSVTQALMAATYCEDRVAALRQLDDRERRKLSGDLHDEVGADLVVLKLYVEMIASELARGSHTPLGPKLDEALALIAHAIESVRRLTLDLGPTFLDTIGFLPALRGVVRQFSLRTGIKVRLQEPRTPVSLPKGHETALYRVLLGALSNVAKHSMARNVDVALRRADNVLTMSIEDDGKGFDPKTLSPDTSFGLTAMRERVRGLRGRLSIPSRRLRGHGHRPGVRIVVHLPLRKGTSA